MKTNNFFKRFCGAAMVALAMATPLFTSCYDDSALNEKLEDIQTEVDKLKSDLAALQAAVDNNLSVVDYKQIEGGYELTMSDGSTITILNGKDGAAGAAGKDGINGTDGKDGKDGEKGEKGDKGDKGDQGEPGAPGTPGEKGDKGEPGEKGDKGDKGDQGEPDTPGTPGEKGEKGDKGDKGDAFFESVELSEDGLYLVITLIDGTVYNLPMAGFNVVFTLADDAKAALKAGDAAEVPYSIVNAAETDEVVVRVLAASNCEAVVLADKQVVKVTPDALGEGYVDIYAINNTTGDIKAKTLSFNAHTCEASATVFYVSPKGGNVEVPVAASVEYELEIDGSWLSHVETKAVRNETVVLAAAAENTSGAANEATVTLKVDGKAVASFDVVQKSYEPELIGEYLESYSQYGQPLSGTLKIEFTDDPSKGAYKVTICGTPFYADYEAGKLNFYDGKYTRTLTVAEDFSRFEVKNLSVGYSTYSDYVAFPALGAPELTEAELALVGTYNESWKYNGSVAAATADAMTIEASDEAAYGRLFVKFLNIEGSYAGCYAKLSEDGTKLELQSNGASHGKYFSIAQPVTLTINSDGSMSCKSLYVQNYKEISDYLAVKVVVEEGGEGDGEGATLESLVGTWHEKFSAGSSYENDLMTIELSDDPSKGQLKVNMFEYGSYTKYKLVCYANLSEDGKTLTVRCDGVDYSGMGTFSEDMVMTVSEGGKKIEFKKTINTSMSMPVGMLEATKIEGTTAVVKPADLVGTWHEKFSAGSSYENDLMTIELSDDPSKGQLKVNMFEYYSYGTYKLVCYANLSEDGTTLTVLTNGVAYSSMGTFSEDMVMTVSEGGKKIEFNKTINTSYSMPIGMLVATKN